MSQPSVIFIIVVALIVMAPIMAVLIWCLVRDNRVENARQRQREAMNDEMWRQVDENVRRITAEEAKGK